MNDRSPEIEAEISLADGDRILLFKYKAGGPKTQDNLVRMRADGGVVWKAKPPESSAGNSWVAVEMVPDEGLIANSWSCWRVRLDPTTGVSIHKQFTK